MSYMGNTKSQEYQYGSFNYKQRTQSEEKKKKRSPNLEFQQGNYNEVKVEIQNHIKNWANYKLNTQQIQKFYQDLEYDHSFIQWIFPNFFSSMFNSFSYRLTTEERNLIINDEQAQQNYIRNYHMFLRFLGIKVEDGQLILENEDQLKKCIFQNTHNLMRIQRVFASLSVLGRRQEALQLLEFFLNYEKKNSRFNYRQYKSYELTKEETSQVKQVEQNKEKNQIEQPKINPNNQKNQQQQPIVGHYQNTETTNNKYTKGEQFHKDQQKDQKKSEYQEKQQHKQKEYNVKQQQTQQQGAVNNNNNNNTKSQQSQQIQIKKRNSDLPETSEPQDLFQESNQTIELLSDSEQIKVANKMEMEEPESVKDDMLEKQNHNDKIVIKQGYEKKSFEEKGDFTILKNQNKINDGFEELTYKNVKQSEQLKQSDEKEGNLRENGSYKQNFSQISKNEDIKVKDLFEDEDKQQSQSEQFYDDRRIYDQYKNQNFKQNQYNQERRYELFENVKNYYVQRDLLNEKWVTAKLFTKDLI